MPAPPVAVAFGGDVCDEEQEASAKKISPHIQLAVSDFMLLLWLVSE